MPNKPPENVLGIILGFSLYIVNIKHKVQHWERDQQLLYQWLRWF